MNKRQRKKHRLGEFGEFGFALMFRTPAPAPPLDADPFLDAFIEAAEDRGLSITGATGSLYDVTVMGLSERRRTISAEQRAALIEWLADRAEVSDLNAGPLVDLWHGPFESDDRAA